MVPVLPVTQAVGTAARFVFLRKSSGFPLSHALAAIRRETSRTITNAAKDVSQQAQPMEYNKWSTTAAGTPAELKDLPLVYKELTKARLSGLVVLTTMAGYAMSPVPLELSTLMWTTVGTGLCVSAANIFNQWREVPHDAQMKRTKARPLVLGRISPAHAFTLGMTSATVGVGTLACMINPLTALLGGANIVLYAGVYTSMKRTSIYNTWAGSVVGAVPPVMGWTAATGSIDPGALVLGAVLFAWQFPHFNSLSWKLRPEYQKAGYKMMSVSHHQLCKDVSLRYSAALVPLCFAAPYVDLTDWYFAVDGNFVNAPLIYFAWKFRQEGDEKSARKLFFYSLIHLPLIMTLLMLHKKRRKPSSETDDDDISNMPVSGIVGTST